MASEILPRAPVGRRLEAVAATTHAVRKVELTKEALEDVAENINRSGLPSHAEHDLTRPPIGRVARAWVEQLDDGEWACWVEAEIFDGIPVLAFAGSPPILALPAPVAPEAGVLEINADPTNYRRPELLEEIVETARAAGEVEADATLVRHSELPDPYLVIVLGSASVAAYWFTKSFFTKMAEPLAEEVGQDLAHVYRAFKRRIAALVASGEPADAEPVTALHLTVPVDGRDVEVEGSLRSRSEANVEHFLDSGQGLLEAAQALLATLPCRGETTKLHFHFDPPEGEWQFAYGLTEGCQPFLVRRMLPSGENEDEPAGGGSVSGSWKGSSGL